MAFRALVRLLLAGPRPAGPEAAACRALLAAERDGELPFQALCTLLELALADPTLPIDDTRTVVTLAKQLALGRVTPADLL